MMNHVNTHSVHRPSWQIDSLCFLCRKNLFRNKKRLPKKSFVDDQESCMAHASLKLRPSKKPYTQKLPCLTFALINLLQTGLVAVCFRASRRGRNSLLHLSRLTSTARRRVFSVSMTITVSQPIVALVFCQFAHCRMESGSGKMTKHQSIVARPSTALGVLFSASLTILAWCHSLHFATSDLA